LLDGFPYSVIGVMPQSFHMPSIQTMDVIGSTNHQLSIGVLVPLAFSKERLAEEMGDLNYFGLARLKVGISVAAANSELNALQHTIAKNAVLSGLATIRPELTRRYGI
jgi:hypothetical protein